MLPKVKSTQKDIIETAMQIVRGKTIRAVTSGIMTYPLPAQVSKFLLLFNYNSTFPLTAKTHHTSPITTFRLTRSTNLATASISGLSGSFEIRIASSKRLS